MYNKQKKQEDMSKEKITPKNPEEIAKAAQEAAIKAAMEQAQAMFGGLAGFQMPDMSSLQEQINAQMKAAVPNLEEIQAQQTAMGTLGGIDPKTVNQAAQQNMAYASRTMEAMLNGDFEEDLTGDGNGAEDMAAADAALAATPDSVRLAPISQSPTRPTSLKSKKFWNHSNSINRHISPISRKNIHSTGLSVRVSSRR